MRAARIVSEKDSEISRVNREKQRNESQSTKEKAKEKYKKKNCE